MSRASVESYTVPISWGIISLSRTDLSQEYSLLSWMGVSGPHKGQVGKVRIVALRRFQRYAISNAVACHHVIGYAIPPSWWQVVSSYEVLMLRGYIVNAVEVEIEWAYIEEAERRFFLVVRFAGFVSLTHDFNLWKNKFEPFFKERKIE